MIPRERFRRPRRDWGQKAIAKLVLRVRRGDKAADQELRERLEPMFATALRHYHPQEHEFEDFRGALGVAYAMALRSWRPRGGSSFTTWLHFQIRTVLAEHQEIRHLVWAGRHAGRIRRLADQIEEREHRPANNHELAERLELPERDVRRALCTMTTVLEVATDDETRRYRQIASLEAANVAETADQLVGRARIAAIVRDFAAELTCPIDRALLERLLEPRPENTAGAIADRLGVSQHQLRARARALVERLRGFALERGYDAAA